MPPALRTQIFSSSFLVQAEHFDSIYNFEFERNVISLSWRIGFAGIIWVVNIKATPRQTIESRQFDSSEWGCFSGKISSADISGARTNNADYIALDLCNLQAEITSAISRLLFRVRGACRVCQYQPLPQKCVNIKAWDFRSDANIFSKVHHPASIVATAFKATVEDLGMWMCPLFHRGYPYSHRFCAHDSLLGPFSHYMVADRHDIQEVHMPFLENFAPLSLWIPGNMRLSCIYNTCTAMNGGFFAVTTYLLIL